MVRTRAAGDGVVALAAVDDIVAGQPVDLIRPAAAGNDIDPIGADDHLAGLGAGDVAVGVEGHVKPGHRGVTVAVRDQNRVGQGHVEIHGDALDLELGLFGGCRQHDGVKRSGRGDIEGDRTVSLPKHCAAANLRPVQIGCIHGGFKLRR